MPAQLLINVITATVPAGAVNYPVAHGLKSNGKAVPPTLILPAAQSAVSVASVDATNVYLNNPSGAPVAVTMRVERGLSMEVDADTLPTFFMSTGDGSGGVSGVAVTAPVTNSGTATAPNIGVSVGATTGTVCAGDDVRLSNERVPVNGSVTDAKVALANKDGLAAVPSMRTLGTAAQQACAGNDTRLKYSQLVNATFANTTGNFGTSTIVDISPVGGPYSVVVAPFKLEMGLLNVDGYIDNATASAVPIRVMLGYGAPGALYQLAHTRLWVPANSRLAIPPVVRLGASFLGYSITDVRLTLYAEIPFPNANITYSITGGTSLLRIISQG